MSQTEQRRLEGVTIGLLLAPEGAEEVEFTEPRSALADVGADVEVVGPETGRRGRSRTTRR